MVVRLKYLRAFSEHQTPIGDGAMGRARASGHRCAAGGGGRGRSHLGDAAGRAHGAAEPQGVPVAGAARDDGGGPAAAGAAGLVGDVAAAGGQEDGMGDALRRAFELVESCQERGAAYGFVMARMQAEQFRDVQAEIDSYLLVFPMVSHIDVTIRLERIYNMLLPPPDQLHQVNSTLL